ncbi:MAG: glutathione synthetase [Planctomycetota bacterium]|nr:glutathione synthetase [Planctomycetota bacterium]MDA1136953.1 glutathione synthetase [Planctomycetota bacterium]
MRLGIVVNTALVEQTGQTTYRLAAEATTRGHEVFIIPSNDFSYEDDDKVRALACFVPQGNYPTSEAYLAALKETKASAQWIALEDLDVLLLRNNPSVQSPWTQWAGINFGRIATRHGVIVLNDPNGLSKAMNKLYLQTFPKDVRPRTVISRSENRVREFYEKEGTIVIKPLQGSGGKNVFIIRPEDDRHFEAMFRAVSADGFVIAQEYLPAAAEGDTRFFIMNGRPLQYKGKYCAFRRVRVGGDMRSNVHAGGKLRRAKLGEIHFKLAEIVRPRLVEDGMFLVGLDIVGDKLMEINVFSPGGFGSAQMFEKVNFNRAVLDALERKVHMMRAYKRRFSNVEMACL